MLASGYSDWAAINSCICPSSTHIQVDSLNPSLTRCEPDPIDCIVGKTWSQSGTGPHCKDCTVCNPNTDKIVRECNQFEDRICETNPANACSDDVDCNGNGTASGYQGDCTCDCDLYFDGPDCSKCLMVNGSPAGIYPKCQVPVYPCDDVDCNGNGTATISENKKSCSCVCNDGYSGSSCELGPTNYKCNISIGKCLQNTAGNQTQVDCNNSCKITEKNWSCDPKVIGNCIHVNSGTGDYTSQKLCETSETCNEVKTCEDYSCGTGTQKEDPKNINCNSNICTDATCCKPVKKFECTDGAYEQGANIYCNQMNKTNCAPVSTKLFHFQKNYTKQQILTEFSGNQKYKSIYSLEIGDFDIEESDRPTTITLNGIPELNRRFTIPQLNKFLDDFARSIIDGSDFFSYDDTKATYAYSKRISSTNIIDGTKSFKSKIQFYIGDEFCTQTEGGDDITCTSDNDYITKCSPLNENFTVGGIANYHKNQIKSEIDPKLQPRLSECNANECVIFNEAIIEIGGSYYPPKYQVDYACTKPSTDSKECLPDWTIDKSDTGLYLGTKPDNLNSSGWVDMRDNWHGDRDPWIGYDLFNHDGRDAMKGDYIYNIDKSNDKNAYWCFTENKA